MDGVWPVALVDAIGGGVVRVAGSPIGLSFLPLGLLALRLIAGSLT